MKAYNKDNIPRAKQLRKNMTPWERKLWYEFLRSYPIRFQRQKAIGSYIVDFYCAKARLVIELDGGGHYEQEQQQKDSVRTVELESMNLTVLRICNLDIDHNFDGVCEYIDHIVQHSLPQSASLTAPSSEGAYYKTKLWRYTMNICIYGASSNKLAQEYYDAAEILGGLMAQQGHTLVFGGGKGGLMGAVARGAYAQGGAIIGVAPRFFDEPGILFEECTEFIYTETMRERKAIMEERSDAFIVLPGGIGTYEEFFEMLTLKQLGRHGKPMAMLNTRGYYDPMAAMLQNTVDEGFMSANCMELFGVYNTPAEVLDYVLKAETVTGSIKRLEDYNK